MVADALRSLDVRLPEPWRSSALERVVSSSQYLTALGVGTRAVWAGEHAEDHARLSVYAVTAEQSALEKLRSVLKREAYAEERAGSGRPLHWAATGPGWVSINVLRSPGDGNGAPLLWSSYLPEATGGDRLNEIFSAVETSDWKWIA